MTKVLKKSEIKGDKKIKISMKEFIDKIEKGDYKAPKSIEWFNNLRQYL